MDRSPNSKPFFKSTLGLMLALGVIAFLLSYMATKLTTIRVADTGSRTLETPQSTPMDKPVPAAAPLRELAAPQAGMVWIAGGEFWMGTDSKEAWPDEQPAHRVRVNGFWMDTHELTNAEFRKFVASTNFQTTAERAPTLEEIMAQSPPGTPPPPPESLVPGSLVFRPTDREVPLNDFSLWWHWTPGANWQHPEGPKTDLAGRESHPVLHVSWDDAVAYAGEDWIANTTLGEKLRQRRPANWQTCGQAIFPIEIPYRTDSSGRHPSDRFHPMGTDCMTWRAMSGNGVLTGMIEMPISD